MDPLQSLESFVLFQKLREEPFYALKTLTMKLHLLFALLPCLLALAAAQDDPRDFEVLEISDDPDDINAKYMQKLQRQASEALSQLDGFVLNSSQRVSMERASGRVPIAPGYTSALDSEIAMFDNSSVSNVPWPADDTTTTTTTATPNTTTARSNSHALSSSRTQRDVPTGLYLCSHRNYLLTWFPGSSGRICFVPWAWNQAITYARCSQSVCAVRLNRRGRCRPSCFIRRYIFAFCFLPGNTSSWGWRWEVKNLPQACRCSSC